MEEKVSYTNIDEYIALFSSEIQELLQKIRKTIAEVAVEATEKISYQMPTFYLHGNLVHFAAFKNHISLYPDASGVSVFESELGSYPYSKGTIQLPYDKPIPYDLIRKIVEYRVKENKERFAQKQTNKKKK